MPLPDVMPDAYKTQTFRIRGQSALVYPDQRLTPEHCVLLRNINIGENSLATTRNGYDEFNTAQITETAVAKAITGLFQFPFKAGTKNVEMAGTKIYADDGTTRTDLTGTAQTLGAENRYRAVFMQNKMIATNGTDVPVTWDGTVSATQIVDFTGTPFTKCEDLVLHQNVLVALNTTESSVKQTTRARWCDIDGENFTVDVSSWPSGNRYEIYHDGAPIIGGCDFNGILLVFKSDGMYPSQLTADFGRFEMVILKEGVKRGFEPVAKHSIIAHPQFAWVVARDGCYIIAPDLTMRNIIRPHIQSDWDALNKSRLQYAVSHVRQEDHQVRTYLSSANNASGHDLVLVYDWEEDNAWFDELTDAVNYAASWVVSSSEYDMLGTTNGYVMQGNNGTTDNGTNIDWEIKMAPNDFGLPNKAKQVVKVDILYRPLSGQRNISYEIIIDQGRETSVSGTLPIAINLKWNTRLKWSSGLKWPGGTQVAIPIFVNRNNTTIQPRLFGNARASIVGYNVSLVPLEP